MLAPPAGVRVPPAHLWIPEYTTTESARDAADLASSIGFELDPEQLLALDALLAENGARWASLEACLIAARQNLKTFLFKVIALYELFVVGSRLVVWTAHEFDTAMEAFRDLQEIIDGTDWLRRRVKLVRNEVGTQGNTKVGIEFLTGQRIRFKARTKTGGRGLTGDVVFLDEAFALQPTHVGSLLPTMAAKSMHGNPRVYYGSSAGQLQSQVLRNLRDRGRPGAEDPTQGDPTLVYVEWCAPEGCTAEDCTHQRGVEGCALDDIEKVRMANPALERRISIAFVETMRRSLPVEEFAREFLGWWDEPATGGDGIPPELWASRGNRDAVFVDAGCALAFDVSPGHRSAAIVACGGPVHVVRHDPGTAWVIPALLELDAAHSPVGIALDPTGPGGAMIPDLEKAGFTIRSKSNPAGKVVLIEGRDATQACEAFLAGVVDGSLEHRDEQSLNQAVDDAGRRVSGDSWRWSRVNSDGDIAPLVAATNARFLWSQPARPQARPSVAGEIDEELYERTLAQIEEEEARALEAL